MEEQIKLGKPLPQAGILLLQRMTTSSNWEPLLAKMGEVDTDRDRDDRWLLESIRRFKISSNSFVLGSLSSEISRWKVSASRWSFLPKTNNFLRILFIASMIFLFQPDKWSKLCVSDDARMYLYNFLDRCILVMVWLVMMCNEDICIIVILEIMMLTL